MANIRNDAGVFFSTLGTYVLFAQVCAGLGNLKVCFSSKGNLNSILNLNQGYVLSIVTENVEIGAGAVPPIIIPLILFAGFFLTNSYKN
jgi:hypothetical protein